MDTSSAQYGSQCALAVIPILPNLTLLLLLVPGLCLSFLATLFSLRHGSTRKALMRLLWRKKAAVLAGLVVLLGSIVSFRYFYDEKQPEQITERPLDSIRDWPMHRGGPLRHGSLEVGPGPSQGGLQWSFRPGEQFYASAATDNHFVYTVGSRNNRGRIFCLESKTGSVAWSAAPSGYAATFSSPVIWGDSLVVGEGLHHTQSGRIVCVDLRPGREGTIAWTYQTNSHVECTPVISKDRVYVAAGDDGLYCLRLNAKSENQRVVWHSAGRDYPDAETSLIVHNGLLYLGLGVGGQALCVVDAMSGREIKRLKMPFPVFSPPSVHDGKLFVGMGQGDYVTPNRVTAGQVCCIDINTLKIDWTTKTPGTVLGSVAVITGPNDGITPGSFWLACGCSDGTLVLLKSDGTVLAQIDTKAPILGSPATAGNCLYVANNAGDVMGLRAPSLEVFWRYRITSTLRQISSPIIHGGQIFLGTETKGFVCLGYVPENNLLPDRHKSPPHASLQQPTAERQ
ncbi:MAG: PQQ-binding-like beta-propeller repeat protein [Planctomycetota bacterium]|nr:PQQ-binding-like beta-propeller repeat protein [Planctomycetota bacterium]